MIWRHEFQVRGTLAFPLDMLRYDECFPAVEGEMYEIANSLISSGSDTPLTIKLVHYDQRAKWEPTVARWQSFGWWVVDYVAGARGVRRERR